MKALEDKKLLEVSWSLGEGRRGEARQGESRQAYIHMHTHAHAHTYTAYRLFM
jgi:hypothetical protein